MALVQLLTGDFETGWATREARWKIPSFSAGYYPAFSEPAWLGAEPIAGKTILICPDEGLGDTIQLARYVPMLAARGARVVLVVQDPLHPLLPDLPGVAQCLPASNKGLPPFDLHCPILSLPLAFETRLDTIPPPLPYLPRSCAGARASLAARLDVAWPGMPGCGSDWCGPANSSTRTIITGRSRCVRWRAFSMSTPLSSACRRTRIRRQATLRERTDILDLTAELTDFGETAGVAVLPRSRDYGGHQRRPSRRVAGAPDLDIAALFAGFPLAARSRRQPLVSERPPVPADRNPRLCEGALDRVRTELLGLVTANALR